MSAADEARYVAAVHAVQSGVAAEMGKSTEPKHLRVGINAAMCDHSALVMLLVSKGLFTLDEYHTAIADEMELEQARYEQRLGVHLA
jgi:hypothetical protein